MQTKKRGPLLNHLDQIEAQCEKGDISLKDLNQIFGPEGHYVLILFFILPFLQPIPLFGLSTPFGLMISVVAYFAYLKKPPYLPQKWSNKTLPKATVLKVAEGSERIFEKMSVILYPRWKSLFKGPFRILNTGLLIFNAILLALPLPIPFSNAIPAWMILFQTLGHLEEDGVFVLLSYVQTIICVIYFIGLGVGFTSGLEFLKAHM